MRTWAWVRGHAPIAVGMVWLVTDRVLRLSHPLVWGGPNIGGGALVLLSYGAVLAGLSLLPAQGGPGPRGRRAQPVRHAAAVANGVLAALYVALVLLPDAPGVPGVDGRTGVSVTAAGSPVLVLAVCRGSVDTVTVAGPSRGRTPGEVLARLTAPAPVAASTAVDVREPPPGWTVALPLQPGAATQPLLTASARGRQGRLGHVAFTAEDLASLDPGTVQHTGRGPEGQPRTSRRDPVASFEDLACDEVLERER